MRGLVMGVVDVYTLPLKSEAARLDYLWEILSSDERERAQRFHLAELRRRFITCRGTLREILSRYLDMDPKHVRFVYSEHGKPSVCESDLQFNVSHSGEWAMLAVTTGSKIGIDIERIDPHFASEQISQHSFSPREVEQLRALPSHEQTAAFFRCWTRKEAYIKARGLGLALRLDSFDVSLGPNDLPMLLRGGENWSIQDLNAPPGYAAAIVTEGSNMTLSVCSYFEAEKLSPG